MTLTLSGTSGLSDVDGSAATPAIRGTDANTGIFFPAADTVGMSTGGSERVRVDSSGNVGIGTASPNAKLTVKAATNQSLYIGASASIGNSVVIGTVNDALSANIPLEFRYGTTAAFLNGGNEAMRLDNSNNLLVGTTSATAKLTTSASSGTIFAVDASSSNDALMRWTASGVSKAFAYWTPATDRLYMVTGSTNGVYLANGGGTWTNASDERVKDIIEPIENATQKLSNWRTVIGKYKVDAEGTRRSFLIAQDVLATFPEAVDTDNPEEYGMRYADTIPLLVAAIQEQQALITSLTARITALEAK